MELKEFVKKVISDLDEAVSEANTTSKRKVKFKGVKETRTALEFDIAVTVESTDGKGGEAGIRVWGLGLGGSASQEQKNSTVSRISFGLDISELTKVEEQEQENQFIKTDTWGPRNSNPAL